MTTTPRVVVARLRRERNAHEREVYLQRKLAGLCTRCGLAPAVEGQQLCDDHLAYQRSIVSASVKRLRGRRRRAKLCIRCGLKSKRATCDLCLAAQGRLPKSKLVGTNQSVNPESDQQRSHTEADGYVRTRYHGRSRRGPPPRAEQDRQDWMMLMAEAHKADASRSLAESEPCLREEATKIWLGQLSLVVRTGMELLDRHRFAWGEHHDEADRKARLREIGKASRPRK